MVKPVLFVIDDEPEDQLAFERDLQIKFADTFQVLQAPSGERALEILKHLKLRNASVALFLVDQHMPGMNGWGLQRRSRSPTAGI